MKAWMVREICKSTKYCDKCPLPAKYPVDDVCHKFMNKYHEMPCVINGQDLVELFQDEEEY